MLWHYQFMKLEISNLSAEQAMREAIQNIAVGPDRGRNISREHAAKAMSAVMNADVDPVQAAVFFIALRMKRESMDEFLGILDALMLSYEPQRASVDDVIILADPFDGYVRNVSMTPFIPAVLTACGLNSVMHGVETVGPKHGVTAHKVYKLAGIKTDLSPCLVAESLGSLGWGYVDQHQYASALFELQYLRDRIVKRTALTTIERLLMPIKGKMRTHLVLGYVHKAYPEIYATLAKNVGYQSVLLLKGVEGGLAPALNKPLRRYHFNGELPNSIDVEKQLIESQTLFDRSSAAEALSAEHDAIQQCLAIGLDVLAGKESISRDSLTLASAQILIAHRPNLSLESAVEKVQLCLDDGTALNCFNALR